MTFYQSALPECRDGAAHHVTGVSQLVTPAAALALVLGQTSVAPLIQYSKAHAMVTQPDAVDVRFGSLADIGSAQVHVAWANSGHVRCKGECPLWANSGHRACEPPKIKRPPTEAASIDGERKND